MSYINLNRCRDSSLILTRKGCIVLNIVLIIHFTDTPTLEAFYVIVSIKKHKKMFLSALQKYKRYWLINR